MPQMNVFKSSRLNIIYYHQHLQELENKIIKPLTMMQLFLTNLKLPILYIYIVITCIFIKEKERKITRRKLLYYLFTLNPLDVNGGKALGRGGGGNTQFNLR